MNKQYISLLSLLYLPSLCASHMDILNNHFRKQGQSDCMVTYEKPVKHTQCSLIPPCTSQDYWASLVARFGQEHVDQKVSNFLKKHAPGLLELLNKQEAGSLWEEIVKLASTDPLVKAIVEDNHEELDRLLLSISYAPLSSVDLRKKCEIASLNLSIDYLSIAFMVAFINTSSQNRYAIFRKLLSAGADPKSTLILGQNALPLLFLALLLNSSEVLEELLQHKAAWFEDNRLADMLRAYEDEFECRSPGDLVPYGDRYQSICIE